MITDEQIIHDIAIAKLTADFINEKPTVIDTSYSERYRQYCDEIARSI